MSLITCIQDQSEYYRKLTKELEVEGRVRTELNEIRRQSDDIALLVDIKQKQVIDLEKQSKKEYEDVRKLRHLSFKSAAATLSGKKKELTAKEEAGYQLAFENEQRVKRELENLKVQLNGLEMKKRELKNQSNKFQDSRAQFDALLEQARKDEGRFSNAEDQLVKSSLGIKKIIQILGKTVNYEPFDIFGTPLLEEEQIRSVEVCKKKMWDIQRLLNAVRTILPEIPHPQTLDVITNNPLLYSQPSWNYFDQAWKVRAVQCLGQMNAVHQNVLNSINWVTQYKKYAREATNRLATAIETAKSRLEAERRHTIESILSGNPNGFDAMGIDHELNPPPPVYEAPSTDNSSQKHEAPLPAIPSYMSLSNQDSPVASHHTENGAENSQMINGATSSSNPFNRTQKSANPNNPFIYKS
ncbi:hypothetical protein CU098_007160 [Rhizopus stolonifer]|uniref:Uncharacterized protein n=1 Tax=Rhizopus stolonifer TaxID=4846 RepID=A0A367J7V0_RHIST|nr:hypothetical protein CU098_007160 [Rhizopus stolonifer]